MSLVFTKQQTSGGFVSSSIISNQRLTLLSIPFDVVLRRRPGTPLAAAVGGTDLPRLLPLQVTRHPIIVSSSFAANVAPMLRVAGVTDAPLPSPPACQPGRRVSRQKWAFCIIAASSDDFVTVKNGAD